MNAKHTPGPWKYQGLHQPFEHKTRGYAGCLAQVDYERKYPDSGLLAQVRAETVFADECEANARLIAAAPDLLEALRECITEDGALAWKSAKNAGRRLEAITQIAKAAIAKAEGE